MSWKMLDEPHLPGRKRVGGGGEGRGEGGGCREEGGGGGEGKEEEEEKKRWAGIEVMPLRRLS